MKLLRTSSLPWRNPRANGRRGGEQGQQSCRKKRRHTGEGERGDGAGKRGARDKGAETTKEVARGERTTTQAPHTRKRAHLHTHTQHGPPITPTGQTPASPNGATHNGNEQHTSTERKATLNNRRHRTRKSARSTQEDESRRRGAHSQHGASLVVRLSARPNVHMARIGKRRSTARTMAAAAASNPVWREPKRASTSNWMARGAIPCNCPCVKKPDNE